MKDKLTDIRQRWSNAKQTKSVTFWIAIAAVILTIYLGFAQAGWVTSGTALDLAGRSSDDAVIARLTSICVAQFDQDVDKDQRLAEFKELTTSTQRSTYVKDQGWATMPDEVDPDTKVARECSEQIMLNSE